MNQKQHKVSLGLPVYNGERYLVEAIESLLAQTYHDFEIVICDNASSDRTQKICKEFAEKDRRIHYYRNHENIGAAANFNLTFELSSGDYFKWASHDDLCKPEFLARCVEVLDNEESVVLVYPKTVIIDEQGSELEHPAFIRSLDAPSPVDRFKVSLINDQCYEIFGLIRRSALDKTPLMGAYAHGDGVLLSRLALLGRFEEIPESLFCLRRHSEQSTHMWVDYRRYAEWFDPNLSGRRLFPYCRMHFEYFRSIRMSKLRMRERARCYEYLTQFTYSRRLFFREEIACHIRQKLPFIRTVYRWLKKLIRA